MEPDDRKTQLAIAKAVADVIGENAVVAVVIIKPADQADEGSLRERFGFTRREAEVATLLAKRRTDAEIAEALGISWHTVRSHVERVFAILRCSNRREAADIVMSRNGHLPR